MFSTLMGCSTVPGLGNPLVLPCDGAVPTRRRQCPGLSVAAHFPDSPCCCSALKGGLELARAEGMEGAGSCGPRKMLLCLLKGELQRVAFGFLPLQR